MTERQRTMAVTTSAQDGKLQDLLQNARTEVMNLVEDVKFATQKSTVSFDIRRFKDIENYIRQRSQKVHPCTYREMR